MSHPEPVMLKTKVQYNFHSSQTARGLVISQCHAVAPSNYTLSSLSQEMSLHSSDSVTEARQSTQ